MPPQQTVTTNRQASHSGFTLIEVLVSSAIVMILSGIAVSLLGSWLTAVRADAALRQVMYQLIAAREQALSQQRAIEVRFVGTDRVQLIRHEVPAGNTVLRIVPLDYNVRFMTFDTMPDTPDGFGNANPIQFGATPIMFTSDGSLIDAQGVPVNGSIFLGLPENRRSARSVTVLGGTGRVRGYRWTGSRWEQRG